MCVEGFTAGFCNNPGHQLYSLFTGQPVPVPNNILPGIDPTAQNILPFFPLPNSGLNTFITTQTKRETNDQFGLRFDHYLSQTDSLNFRYMFSGGPTTDPLSPAGANVPGFPIGADDRAQNFVVQETHVFSSTVIAVARISYLRNKFLFGEHVNHESLSDLGFQYQPSLPAAAGPPFIQVGGYASVGDPITGPRNTYQNTFDYSAAPKLDSRKARIQVRRRISATTTSALCKESPPTASLYLRRSRSPTALPAFSRVHPYSFCRAVGNFQRGIRGQASNAYAQDTYKVTSRLTLNLGVRYELPSPYTEINNRQNSSMPGVQSKVLPNRPSGPALSRRSRRSPRD